MIILLAILLSIIFMLGVSLIKAYEKIQELSTQLQTTQESFEKDKLLIRQDAKKRSGAVLWGKSIEHFLPFTSQFPVPVEDCKFLGMPVDYVAFTDTGSSTKCSVHFIEVKSGNSTLLTKQKNIKKAIEENRVRWHEIFIEGNNIKEI